ncbi:unnamed protein product [Rotaria socialis]
MFVIIRDGEENTFRSICFFDQVHKRKDQRLPHIKADLLSMSLHDRYVIVQPNSLLHSLVMLMLGTMKQSRDTIYRAGISIRGGLNNAQLRGTPMDKKPHRSKRVIINHRNYKRALLYRIPP